MNTKKIEFTEWLFRKGRFYSNFESFTDKTCQKLVSLGIPITRVRISFRTLHPQVTAWTCVWEANNGSVVSEVTQEIIQSEDYSGSPIEYVYEYKKNFRQRLTALPLDAHAVLQILHQQGMTDYFACPILFSNNTMSGAMFATHHVSGFSDECIDFLSDIGVYLAAFIETLATRRLARSLLETYVGPRTGRRILAGQIRRGDGEEISAAIWYSDFRNFTQYTENLSIQELLEVLNQYFEIIHDSVDQHGGEVLRFIGDAMLIIFPQSEDSTLNNACQRALESAKLARKKVYEINIERRQKQKPIIEFGVGLDAGLVMYGNVGAPTRLDFTVMGTAVNRTARLESLTKELNSPILVSSQFNDQIRTKGDFQGSFSVKGVNDLLEVYSISTY